MACGCGTGCVWTPRNAGNVDRERVRVLPGLSPGELEQRGALSRYRRSGDVVPGEVTALSWRTLTSAEKRAYTAANCTTEEPPAWLRAVMSPLEREDWTLCFRQRRTTPATPPPATPPPATPPPSGARTMDPNTWASSTSQQRAQWIADNPAWQPPEGVWSRMNAEERMAWLQGRQRSATERAREEARSAAENRQQLANMARMAWDAMTGWIRAERAATQSEREREQARALERIRASRDVELARWAAMKAQAEADRARATAPTTTRTVTCARYRKRLFGRRRCVEWRRSSGTRSTGAVLSACGLLACLL